jgi:protein-tyrosine phosphatase
MLAHMRLPNGARLVIEGHRFAGVTTNLERFHTWVACAVELNPGYFARENKLTLWCPLDDCRPPRRGDMARAHQAASFVAEQLQNGKHVLVTCAMGLNRSALVAGLALRRLGFTGEQVVETIRHARGPMSLNNPAFLEQILS